MLNKVKILIFRLSSSAEIPTVVTGGSFFSRGSRVRYSGRVERELSEDLALWANRSQNRGYRGRIKAPPLSKRAMTDPMIVRQGSKGKIYIYVIRFVNLALWANQS